MRSTPASTTPPVGTPVLLDARISYSPDDGTGGPRQQWIEVSFDRGSTVSLSYITFHNYYCAAITISHTNVRAEGDQRQHEKGRLPTWQVAVPKLTLMATPHCEDDAQNYHELSTVHFAPEFDHRRVTRLRICCIQPSPSWREYTLRNLRFYSIDPPSTPSLQPPPSLTPTERELAATIVDHLVDLGQVTHQIRQTLTSARESTVGRGGANGAARRGAELELAPYLVGEWSDELRLGHFEVSSSPARSGSGKPPAASTRGVAEGVPLSTLESVKQGAERWVSRAER